MVCFCMFSVRYVKQARLYAITRIRLLWVCGSQPFPLEKPGCWFHGLTISHSPPGPLSSRAPHAPVCHSWSFVLKLWSAVYISHSLFADDIAGQFFNENGVQTDPYLLSQEGPQMNLRFIRELCRDKIEARHSHGCSCLQSTNTFPSEWWKGK